MADEEIKKEVEENEDEEINESQKYIKAKGRGRAVTERDTIKLLLKKNFITSDIQEKLINDLKIDEMPKEKQYETLLEAIIDYKDKEKKAEIAEAKKSIKSEHYKSVKEDPEFIKIKEQNEALIKKIDETENKYKSEINKYESKIKNKNINDRLLRAIGKYHQDVNKIEASQDEVLNYMRYSLKLELNENDKLVAYDNNGNELVNERTYEPMNELEIVSKFIEERPYFLPREINQGGNLKDGVGQRKSKFDIDVMQSDYENMSPAERKNYMKTHFKDIKQELQNKSDNAKFSVK